ncbi:serine threonine- kinase Nek4 isoform X1 [Pelobates cultripes]|uniref:non-specific serine/threonine protein kinase n=2 Tax=Pelobates cultripes TaxID=61616 RepID=A0AAD1T294_PELCU|nr:serine threonine- kinase Nek4 isoform X1 [Pelobates cultripes]
MHRDLKTQNIFLTRSNIIKVGDLGIARVLESQYEMASTLIGTPYYMSPELFSNKPYNYKSDVWALGCCVYEMATLKHAFNAKDMNSLVYRIIEGKLPPMPKEYSCDLGDLIGTMLSQKPEKRPSVRQILKKPFIRQNIAIFLQTTKLPEKRRKKTSESSSNKSDGSSELQARAGSDHMQKPQKNKVKSPVKNKPASPDSVAKNRMSETVVSISTLSKVDIDILETEKEDSNSGHVMLADEPRTHLNVKEKDSKKQLNIMSLDQENQGKTNSASRATGDQRRLKTVPTDNIDTLKLLQPIQKNDAMLNAEDLEDTDKLLEPFIPVIEPDGLPLKSEDLQSNACSGFQPHSSVSEPSLSRQRRQRDQRAVNSDQFHEVPPRPLPSLPTALHHAVKKTQSSESATSVNQSKNIQILISEDNRPLSARERRRLKQSQEEIFNYEPTARRYSVGSEQQSSNGPRKSIVGNSSNHSIPNIALAEKNVARSHSLSEDDLSSSASSSEKSEGDLKDGKSDSNEMQDLVQLMTQTLHMEKDQMPLIPCREFRLHRKYRDTLRLHGKSAGVVEEICFGDIPQDNLSAPEKFRRMIEALRTDVVQGLGVKLLEEVYDIMEEEDDTKKEVQLQKHLGDKYTIYSQKVRQLKFFEENSKF